MTKAMQTQEEYKLELEEELARLQAKQVEFPTLYKERRIEELTRRIAQLPASIT